MTQDKKADEPLKVVDKRRFTSDGDARPDAPTPEPPQPVPASTPQEPKGTPTPDSKQAKTARQAYESQAASGGGTKIDFETVILSISTSAMFQLGLMQDQAGQQLPADPEAARHTIDMLGVLQEKTQGNLTATEQKLLDQVLHELRMAYVQVASGKLPKGPKPPAGP
jgi:hypothetical protein